MRPKKSMSSKGLPMICRPGSKSKPQIPHKVNIEGYFCPFCDDIKIQRNPNIVLQHYRAKQPNHPEPSLNDMIDAAVKFNHRGKKKDSYGTEFTKYILN